MKKVILIIGSNAVGKSTTAKQLLNKLPNSAYIDADSLRAINPFQFTDGTKEAVIKNIYCVLCNYLLCKDIETIIFPYSLHGERNEIWEQVLEQIKAASIELNLIPIILKCSKEENIRRAKLDNRGNERIERGMKNTFDFYDGFSYPVIDTTDLNVEEVVEKIMEML